MNTGTIRSWSVITFILFIFLVANFSASGPVSADLLPVLDNQNTIAIPTNTNPFSDLS